MLKLYFNLPPNAADAVENTRYFGARWTYEMNKLVLDSLYKVVSYVEDTCHMCPMSTR